MQEIYEDMSDEVLIRRFRGGDDDVMEYLLEKYKNLVKKYVHLLFLQGGDSDDLMQEGMIGLFKAVRDYQEDRGSFSAFARLCVRRQLFSAVEKAGRKKHAPLNHYESLYDEALKLSEAGPESQVIEHEYAQMLETRLRDKLSDFEEEVLNLYLDGKGYREIAGYLNRSPKVIDNAIQRIRSKAQKLKEIG